MIALLESSITMSAIALLYIAITPWLAKKFSAKGRYYTWLVIIVGFIIPFRLHPQAAVIRLDTLIPAMKTTNAALDQAVSHTAATSPNFPWYMLAGGIWLAGAIVFLACHAIRHRRFLKMVRRWGAPVSDRETLGVLHEVQAKLGVTQQVRLRACPGISSPMLLGFVRPTVLLPSDSISIDGLSLILKHELVHWKRKDVWFKTIVLLAASLHWFNPLVYRIAREIALQCELACDEEVIKHSDLTKRQQYVEAIIGVMRQRSRGKSAFSTSFSDSKLSMKQRVLSIMDTRSKKWGISLLAVIVVATVGTGVVLQLSPAPSETATPEQTWPMTTVDGAERETNDSLDDSATPADTAEDKQSGDGMESGIREGSDAVEDDTTRLQAVDPKESKGEPAPSASDDIFTLVQDSEQNSSVSASPEAKREENKPTLRLFDGPGDSRR
ncbi:M56 family metallopeptidase [Paenibacillus sp. CECT 9249]|nr:M56 family metallopeptidase [Paenibacillus sp. CECT 9249]